MSTTTQPLAGTFAVDPVHSSFYFEVTHMGVGTFRASFDDVDARVVADDQGVRFEGAARVESISIRQPQEFRDHVVYGADFFDANRHPEIAFSSDDVLLSDDGTARVTGQLTIRGITKPFTSTGTYRPSVEDPYGNLRAGIELTATVDRRDWGMDWQAPLPKGGDALGYAVQLHTHVELVKQNGSQ